MNFKSALVAAAALTALSGVASAADIAGGVYSFVATTTAVSDVAAGQICASFGQAVGGHSYTFATYVPSTPSAAGSLLQVAAASNAVYTIAESIPAGKPLVGTQGGATTIHSVTFPLGVAQDNGAIGGITLKYTSATAVTQVLTIQGHSCTVKASIKATKVS